MSDEEESIHPTNLECPNGTRNTGCRVDMGDNAGDIHGVDFAAGYTISSEYQDVMKKIEKRQSGVLIKTFSSYTHVNETDKLESVETGLCLNGNGGIDEITGDTSEDIMAGFMSLCGGFHRSIEDYPTEILDNESNIIADSGICEEVVDDTSDGNYERVTVEPSSRLTPSKSLLNDLQEEDDGTSNVEKQNEWIYTEESSPINEVLEGTIHKYEVSLCETDIGPPLDDFDGIDQDTDSINQEAAADNTLISGSSCVCFGDLEIDEDLEDVSPLTSLRLAVSTRVRSPPSSQSIASNQESIHLPKELSDDDKNSRTLTTLHSRHPAEPSLTPSSQTPPPPGHDTNVSCMKEKLSDIIPETSSNFRCTYCGRDNTDSCGDAYSTLEKRLYAVESTSKNRLKHKDNEIEKLQHEIELLKDVARQAEAERDNAVASKLKIEAVSAKQSDRIGQLQAKLRKIGQAGIEASPVAKIEGQTEPVMKLSPKQNQWSEMYRDKIGRLEVALTVAKFRETEQSKAYEKLRDKYNRMKLRLKALRNEKERDDSDANLLAERIIELEKAHENMEAFIAYIVENSGKLEM